MGKTVNDPYRLLGRLLGEGKITPEQQEAVQLQAMRANERVEEALLSTGVMTEQTLLKYIASKYKTRFVTTERLAAASVPPAVLKLVPRRFADRLQVCPILYEARTQTLSVITPNPGDFEGLNEIKFASGVRDVVAYVARPAAVSAAIQKFYRGVAHAFSALQTGAAPANTGLDISYASEQGVWADDQDLAPPSQRAAVPIYETPKGPPAKDFYLDLDERPAVSVAPPVAPNVPRPIPIEVESRVKPPPSGVQTADYQETLNILVTLLEHGRNELRGHSSQVARLSRSVSERAGLDPEDTYAIVLASYLHDLGKTSLYHLTAFNVAQYEGHRAQALKSYLAPTRLFEAAHLPALAIASLNYLYETFDGSGFPEQLSGKEIPIGARILAITETYADLTVNPRNPFRKVLSSREAWDAIAQFRGRVFDPSLVDVFRLAVLGDDVRARLLGERRSVLLVDPDPEETTVLEMRFLEHGYDVRIAREFSEAAKILETAKFDAVITEVDLGTTDGFSLLDLLRSKTKTSDVPVVFLTHRGDRDSVRKGFDAGAADYLVKPASAELVVAKIQQLADEKNRQTGGPSRGVRGSLSEMALPDVLQVLSHGRKTGSLNISSGRFAGEVHLVEGEVHHAAFGSLGGPEAFYALLALREGEFVMNPGASNVSRTIHESMETMLLEGMRRLDEQPL